MNLLLIASIATIFITLMHFSTAHFRPPPWLGGPYGGRPNRPPADQPSTPSISDFCKPGDVLICGKLQTQNKCRVFRCAADFALYNNRFLPSIETYQNVTLPQCGTLVINGEGTCVGP